MTKIYRNASSVNIGKVCKSGKLMAQRRVGKNFVSALAGQKILLGVCGGIAAYKSADLLRRLRDHGAEVRVVMTQSAQHFIGATTFQALSGFPVRTSLWDEAAEAAMSHIELARWATHILIAPASANSIARLVQGNADDLLSTVCLASDAPIMCAPAMNRVMWANAATQANVLVLKQRGVQFVGPAEGEQACGEVGAGRMSEPQDIIDALVAQTQPQVLAGKKILITAGPTFEDIDPVRFIGNRSSGKMGFALASAARAMGAEVTLIAGPVSLCTPFNVGRTNVRSAAQMRTAVLNALAGQDVYIGAAAVADFTPTNQATQKIKKTQGCLDLDLVPTADILSEVAAHALRPKCVVGFAAETEQVEHYARGKLERKNLDLIAANHVAGAGIGFESEDNALTVFSKTERFDIGKNSKYHVAAALLKIIAKQLESNS
jgi:phosphopantothenoylcysteine decarboxylase / phosphopantothenate---cysteine ligase